MPVKIDIIILSYAKTDELKQTTLDCVASLATSENPKEIVFETLVIESNRQLQPYQYPSSKTIYPDAAFGYNKYMNIGIGMTSNLYVCLCNNDLIFHPGWATEILKTFNKYPEIESANPYSDIFDYDARIRNGNNIILRDKNPDIGGILMGWCIFVKRSLFEKIGRLDERFTFWYADNDYDMTLRKHGIKHALVKSSFVTHLACQSHDLLLDKKEELTTGQEAVFKKKWHKKSLMNWFIKKINNQVKKIDTFFYKCKLNRFKKELKYCGKNTFIQFPVRFEGPEHIALGNNVSINAFVHMWGHGKITIGNDCLIASHVSINSVTHDTQAISYRETVIEKEVIIGNNVWIGSHAVILPGIKIGDNAIVGAGAVVTKDVPPGTTVVGVPARVVTNNVTGYE